MGILDNQLKNSILGLKGQTPKKGASTFVTSTLHNVDSLSPSKLDLDATTPQKYLDNKPN